eukprot:GHVO01004869.1.p4 GENE.GHVO01004869.1~~GHVO01004869.1.p4  ORF type:complete len:100 (-),score=8.28 GHVO01004869.1:695-994(-)
MQEWLRNMASMGRITPSHNPDQVTSRHFVTGDAHKQRVVGDFENVTDRLLLAAMAALGRVRTELDTAAYYSVNRAEDRWIDFVITGETRHALWQQERRS